MEEFWFGFAAGFSVCFVGFVLLAVLSCIVVSKDKK